MYPVTIRGTTIVIREIETNDVDAIARIICAPDVLRYTTWRGPADREAAAAFVRMAQETATSVPRTEYLLAIVDLDSGEVGAGGIRIENADAGRGSLRCLLHPDWWNRGIGTKAEDGRRFRVRNPRLESDRGRSRRREHGSTSLLERAGLTGGAVRPGHHLAPDGRRRDSVAYVVSREEWAARQ
jgi:[ribosomal protein S5]-alanine N-acetyltransferase